MLRKLISKNQEGFTLIELMIVIAIIGVLAAIAIPNFISYRNKSYCTQVSGDAQAVKAAIGAYFSNPSRTKLTAVAKPTDIDAKIVLSGSNDSTSTITQSGDVFTIVLKKLDSNKCTLGGTFTTYLGTKAVGGWSN